MADAAIKQARVELFGLPRITSLAELASHTRLSRQLIHRLVRLGDANYKTYQLAKKSGGTRTIAQPCRELKAVQAWILRHILDRLRTTDSSRGFERGATLLANAEPHIGAKGLVCIDIEDFFGSIGANRVMRIFQLAGYEQAAARLLTRLCTWQDRLPQGSPTSPKLANLACFRLDRRLAGFAGQRGLVYTRYADDMTFSSFSPARLFKSVPMLVRIVRDCGFVLNPRKTRACGASRQLKVTGLVLAPSSAGIGRQKLRLLRARVHQLSKATGKVDTEVAALQGWLAYLWAVDPPRYRMLAQSIVRLRSRPNSPLMGLNVFSIDAAHKV